MTEKLKKIENELFVVCLFTYNHVKYIKDAVESILMQKTSFEFKILISDDCSNDGTSEILEEYAKLYPEKIVYIRHFENVGMIKNIVGILTLIKSKYVALIEGDDYWLSPIKLQIQFELLENDLSSTLCCHNALVFDTVKVYTNRTIGVFNTISWDPVTLDLESIVDRWRIPTASIVYKNSLIEWPDFSMRVHNWDFLLQLLAVNKGKVIYLAQLWSVYRLIQTGNTYNSNYNTLRTYERQKYLLSDFNSFTQGVYHKILYKKIKNIDKGIRKQKNYFYKIYSLLRNEFISLAKKYVA